MADVRRGHWVPSPGGPRRNRDAEAADGSRPSTYSSERDRRPATARSARPPTHKPNGRSPTCCPTSPNDRLTKSTPSRSTPTGDKKVSEARRRARAAHRRNDGPGAPAALADHDQQDDRRPAGGAGARGRLRARSPEPRRRQAAAPRAPGPPAGLPRTAEQIEAMLEAAAELDRAPRRASGDRALIAPR